ncbi:MAG: EAL domain-containing protein [Gammaproteobacteria bacterium]|nr:EAL domain-containing protein [Gammaproteobacteria bacterium]
MHTLFIYCVDPLGNVLVLLGLTLVFCSFQQIFSQLTGGQFVLALGLGCGGIAVVTRAFAIDTGIGPPFAVDGIAVAGAAVFGGPWAALLSAIPAGTFRFMLSEPLLTVGMDIVAAAVIGAAFHQFWGARGRTIVAAHFWGLGVILALCGAVVPLLEIGADGLTWTQAMAGSARLFVAALVGYPLGVFLFCRFIKLQIQQNDALATLEIANDKLGGRAHSLEVDKQNLQAELRQLRGMEQALRENEEKFRAITEQSGEGLLITNAEGAHLLVNPKFCALTGYSAAELQGMTIQDLLPKDSRISLFPKVMADQSGQREVTITRKDGTLFQAEIGGYPINLGKRKLALGIVRDISARKQAEAALRESEEHFRNLVQGSLQGIVIERSGKPLFVNQAYAAMFGYDSVEEILQLESLNVLCAPDDRERLNQYRVSNQAESLPTQYEYRGISKEGQLIWLEAQTRTVNWQGMCALQSTVVNISARKEYQEQLLRQAHFDKITNLPNRVLALDRLNQSLVRAQRRQSKVGVMFIDLDRFKQINDTLGHGIGDTLLGLAGERLLTCVRREDTVARLGGDEFTIILPDLRLPMDVVLVAGKIVEVFGKSFAINNYEVFVTPSIGITLYPDDAEDADTLMRNADAAMYQAKEAGRNNYQFYTPILNEKAVRRLKIDSLLRQALDRRELNVHYQPIIDLRSGQVVAVEALCRWYNPELGHVTPDEFIPIAEETGLIIDIGEWVLVTACHQMRAWQSEGLPPLRLAVNVSSRQFRNSRLVQVVMRVLRDSDLQPDFLELEITESLLMNDLPEVSAILRNLNDLGVRLSVDDFGIGYSSLSYLRRFPVDMLKIDKSFIGDITTDPDDMTLVDAIIAMGRSLGLEVAAEGVETRAQLELIRERGCDLAQGFHFGRPLPPDRFVVLFRDWLRAGDGIL